MPTLTGNDTTEPLVAKIAIAGAAGSTGVFTYRGNPWGIDVIVKRALLRITTQSTGACTLDIGQGATAATASDLLFDGLSGAAAGLFDNAIAAHAGTNGLQAGVLGATEFITVKEASGDVTALAATLYIEAIPAI